MPGGGKVEWEKGKLTLLQGTHDGLCRERRASAATGRRYDNLTVTVGREAGEYGPWLLTNESLQRDPVRRRCAMPGSRTLLCKHCV